MQVIYIDTLFLLNATVDYLLLLASARVAGEPLPRLRFLLAAVIGGLYAVGIFLFPFLESPFYKLLIGILIMTIAFGKSHRLLRQSFIFLALSFAFAGGIFAITWGGGQSLTLEGGVLYSAMDLKIVLLSAAGCYLLLTFLFENFATHTSLSGELVSLSLTLDSKELSFTALVDTGNTLKDPISGLPIVVIEGLCLTPFFPKTLDTYALFHPTECLAHYSQHPFSKKLRLIPYQAVGVQGLLLVLKVDSIHINNALAQGKLVALSPTPVSDGGYHKALVGVGFSSHSN